MRKLELFTNDKTYMFPNGALAPPEEILQQFPAVAAFPHIIETDEGGQMCFAVMNLASVCSQNGIDPATPPGEAIPMIEAIYNAPPPEPEPQSDPLAEALGQLAGVIEYDEAVAAAVFETQENMNALVEGFNDGQ